MGYGRHGNEHVPGVLWRNWEEYQMVRVFYIFLHFTIEGRKACGAVDYLDALRNENMSIPLLFSVLALNFGRMLRYPQPETNN